jgi:hypothetical protein
MCQIFDENKIQDNFLIHRSFLALLLELLPTFGSFYFRSPFWELEEQYVTPWPPPLTFILREL